MAQVITVAGAISPEELGVTMSHTHVLDSFLCYHVPPQEASRIALADSKTITVLPAQIPILP